MTAADVPLSTMSISLDRGRRPVLRDVTVSFRSGAATAIVGPSGAGKTSLLRCLNRLEEPHAGRVLLDGVDVREIAPPELRRRVGMIFQTPVIFEGGVRANLAYGLESVTDEQVRMKLISPLRPGLIQGKDDDFLYLIMPIRLAG